MDQQSTALLYGFCAKTSGADWESEREREAFSVSFLLSFVKNEDSIKETL